jgi:uncharacterized protein with HEPN domain
MRGKPEQTIQEYLRQFLEWSDRVDRVMLAVGSKDIEGEEILQLALSRALEVCGEICGKLLAQYPEWSELRRSSGLDDAYRLRNRISHGYDTLDAKLLMVIAAADLPELRSKVIVWLDELNG